MKKRVIISIGMSILCTYLQPATLIPGNATGNNLGVYSFNQPIVAKVYNPANGDFIVGLSNAGTSATTTPYTIAKFNQLQNYTLPATTVPIFQAIAQSILQDTTIDFLALANAPTKTDPLLAAVPVGTVGSLSATQIFVQTSQILTGSIVSNQSASLLGTNTLTPTANGSVVGGIAQLEGAVTQRDKKNYFLAAVFPSGSYFGALNSGIAVVNAVLNTPVYPNAATLTLNQVAAEPDQTGIKASLLDPTVESIKIAGTGSPVIVRNRVSMFWDYQLQRLYTGLQLATNAQGTGTAGDGAASIVVGRLDELEQGELTFESFLSQDAINSLVAGQATNIVAATQETNTPLNLAAAQPRVMHTTTGASYLIVWGGNGTITVEPTIGGGTVGNLLWALPLVDLQDPSNPEQGLIADKTMFNTTDHRFEIPATNEAGLTNISDSFAQVGGGPLPVQPSTPISGVGSGLSDPLYTTSAIPIRDTLDIVVAGDTVYVAIASPQTDIDDAGVFYSQAMFDEKGEIIRWTPWAKRAFPFEAFFNIPQNNGNVRYVSVNTANGNIIAVDGSVGQAAKVTSWYSGKNGSPLVKLIEQALCQGCYSALDLDQSLSVLSVPGPSRYALFGGVNSVAFARTSFSRSETAPFNQTPPPATNPDQIVPAPQKPLPYFKKIRGNSLEQGCICPNQYIENVCQPCLPPIPMTGIPLTYDPENFLVTALPAGAGAIKTLEYSKQAAGTPTTPNNTNYFFAGSDGGLFAFAQTGTSGFDASMLQTFSGELDQPPFSSGQWVPIPQIKGSVLDIKTSGLTLYVMTVQLPFKMPIVYSVYRIDYADTLTSMFNAGNIYQIAQTNTPTLGQTRAFYGMQIINMTSTNGLPQSEQLVLATNNGLYMSARVDGVQKSISTSDSNWTLVDGSDNTLYCGIGGMDTILPTTAWPFSLGPLNNPQIYNRSRIWQVNGGTTENNDGMTPNPFEFVPENFNANVFTGFKEPFESFNPITYFMSDGARRFFITQNQSGRKSTILQVSPYNVVLNRMLSPMSIFDSSLQYVNNYNWVKLIGATGILMAGTNTGVVALE